MTLIRISSALAVAVVLALAGCTTTLMRPVLLPLPARPVLTPITADQVQCLAPATYTLMVDRERALRTWGLAEESVLKANNAKAKP